MCDFNLEHKNLQKKVCNNEKAIDGKYGDIVI